MAGNRMAAIVEEIQHYFQFLFNRGFAIYKVTQYTHKDWEVILSKDNMGLDIYSDQGAIGIGFTTMDAFMKYRIGLTTMVLYLTKQHIDSDQLNSLSTQARRRRFKELAGLLEKYLDQIIPYFGKDYDRYQHEILVAQQKALDLYLHKHIL